MCVCHTKRCMRSCLLTCTQMKSGTAGKRAKPERGIACIDKRDIMGHLRDTQSKKERSFYTPRRSNKNSIGC